MQCLFRVCCNVDDDEDDISSASASHEHPHHTASASSSLLLSTNNSNNDTFTTLPAHPAVVERDEPQDTGQTTPPPPPTVRGGGLFRMFRPRFHKRLATEDDLKPSSSSRSMNSPLRTACDFHSSGSYPTLSPHEIVLPGSQLQHEMAKIMSLRHDVMTGDECVICLEGFDESNPRMPTQCGCGINQTYFHLPCLYQWIEQGGEKCPTCRQTITWHEFC